MSIDEAFRRPGNNFNTLRLIAAMLVLWSHSYALTGDPNEIFFAWSGGYDSGGGYGVCIFFVISGFLVTSSLQRRSDFSYFKSRILRIVPALVGVSLFDIFVIGPAFTELTLGDYFRSPETWLHLHNPMVFPIYGNLPKVFDHHLVPGTNGSLWTLPLECGFYVILPLLSVLRLLGRRMVLVVLGGLGAAYVAGTLYFGLGWPSPGPVVWTGALAYPVLRFGLFFLAGSAFWIWRDRVPLSGGLACGLLLFLFMMAKTPAAGFAYIACFPYLVLYAALARPLPFDIGHKIGDLSYGVYLYAYPLQQAAIELFGLRGQALLLGAIVTPVACLLAYLSWRMVERPILSLRAR